MLCIAGFLSETEILTRVCQKTSNDIDINIHDLYEFEIDLV